ncbi:MAG TPA: ferritin-like domain-containing protein [Longimicrobiales bacterium]|nr:ferritin-like domain-containing protein [Longimicrobiales bacterium]
MKSTNMDTAQLVAVLNDLLQLDHDAALAYGLAIRELESDRLRSELEGHLQDHERHIEELENHIERLDGMRMPMPHLTGAFKLAVQAAAGPGNDRAVLLAFKANEMQARDKYVRVADMTLPPDVAETVNRAAADEERHYQWAVRSLEDMGASREDRDVKATKAFAHVHGRTADAVEAAERGAMHMTEHAHRALRNNSVRTVVTAGLALVGAGVVLQQFVRRR